MSPERQKRQEKVLERIMEKGGASNAASSASCPGMSCNVCAVQRRLVYAVGEWGR